MKIVVLSEGSTEAALRTALRGFVENHIGNRPRVGVELPTLKGSLLREKLATLVENYASKADVAGVIALTDVYPTFGDAKDAKQKLREKAGDGGGKKLRVHVAKHDLEAWLMPFWDDIAKSLGVPAKVPGAKPEQINHQKPPSVHLKELFARAKNKYVKDVDGPKWLTADRLEQAAKSCPELKLFLDSLLEFAGVESTPSE